MNQNNQIHLQIKKRGMKEVLCSPRPLDVALNSLSDRSNSVNGPEDFTVKYSHLTPF